MNASAGIATATASPASARGLDWRTVLLSPWFALVSPLALLLVWIWVTETERFPPLVLVPPLEVARAAIELYQSGELQMHLSISLQRLFLGVALGGALGVLFGAAMALSRHAEHLLSPFFHVVLRQMPTAALIPVFILIFGIGETFKVFIVTKASFVVMGLASFDAVKTIPSSYFEVARVYGLSRAQVFRRVILPAAVPGLLTGLRLTISRGWIVLVIAELLAADSGVGQMMEMARQLFRMDIVLVGIVLTGVVGFTLDRLCRGVEHLLLRWRRS